MPATDGKITKGRRVIPGKTVPTEMQDIREVLRGFARPGSPARMPAPDEYEGPSIRMIKDAFPGQLLFGLERGPWLWSHGFLPERPPEIREASEVYCEHGGQMPGPALWYDDLLKAKRGTHFRYSQFTTLYYPIDIYSSIQEQIAEAKRVCEAAKRKLIEVSGHRPVRRGAAHDRSLARNVLMVVLRRWKRDSIPAIAARFYGSRDERARTLTARRIHLTRRLLMAHAIGYKEPPKKPR